MYLYYSQQQQQQQQQQPAKAPHTFFIGPLLVVATRHSARQYIFVRNQFVGRFPRNPTVGGRNLVTLGTRFLSVSMTEAFKSHGVVPDVIDKPPSALLKVTFPNNISLDIAKELTPTQVKDLPIVKWDADSSAFYALCMTDPDAPSRKEPTFREWHHWLVVNIPGDKVGEGEVLSEYIGSGPPPDTGLHRYVYLIYKQPGKIKFEEKRLPNTSAEGREKFSIRKFAAKHKLGEPVAGTFYQAQYDDYVPILYKQLGA